MEDVDGMDMSMEDQTKVSTLFPIPQNGLKLVASLHLPWPPKYWNYKHVPCLVLLLLRQGLTVLPMAGLELAVD